VDIGWHSGRHRPGENIDPDTGPYGGPLSLTTVNGIVFFGVNDMVHGLELWKSDGTSAGTVLVEDIAIGMDGSYPDYLTNVNGTLFFVANNIGQGSELWKSDGTSAGTVMVKDIHPNPQFPGGPANLVNIDGTVYFSTNDGVGGQELWKSDGTVGGTVLVQDIAPGPDGSSPFYFTLSGRLLFFIADDGTTGGEVWAMQLPNLAAHNINP
jgi:ELWxxDGT repeat protein